MAEDLKVFISWSGSLSKAVAKELADLLRVASDRIVPFMSDLSIEGGTRGLSVIADELGSTSVGILVVTRDNWQSPWLNYEAGALSKEVEPIETRVIPLLVDLEGADMASTPVVQFQYRKLDKENIERLLKELAVIAGADPERAVGRVMPQWAAYEKSISEAVEENRTVRAEPSGPSNSDLLREILETVRDIQRTQPPAKQAAILDEESRGKMYGLLARGTAAEYGYLGPMFVSQDGETWEVAHDGSLSRRAQEILSTLMGPGAVSFRKLTPIPRRKETSEAPE